MPKISVIIPVYNAKDYLNRCLDSVCNQTLSDIEIICVNDFSTDSSAKILDEYAARYKNLKILHLEKNYGESTARNRGIELATGEYLAFVDNDDEVDVNFYEKLYQKAEEKNADIVKGQAIEISYNGTKNLVKQMRPTDDRLTFITYWWSAIYKRSLIAENKISFPAHHCLGGDLLFLNNALIAAKDLQLVDGVYYHYYRREDSGDSKILDEKKIKSALSIYEMIADNMNAAASSSVAYNYIFHHFISGCFYLSFRSENLAAKKLCFETAMNIFDKCRNKDSLQLNFEQSAPQLYKPLKNKDLAELENILCKCKSRMDLIMMGLRSRIIKK